MLDQALEFHTESTAIVICHGSYHTHKTFIPFLTALRDYGFEAYCPQLPTSNLLKLNVGDPTNSDYNRDPPPGGYPHLSDDAAEIINLLRRLIEDRHKDVLLIGHSSGGVSATAAAIPELLATTRRAKSLSGGIVGIFYECAFMIPVGESVNTLFQPKDGHPIVPPYCKLHDRGLQGLSTPQDGAKYFFNGLDEQTAKYYETTLTASPALTSILENDPLTTLPCAYLLTTENDLALPLAFQEKMIALQGQKPGTRLTVYKIACGHSPHLVRTSGLVARVKDFIQNQIQCLSSFTNTTGNVDKAG